MSLFPVQGEEPEKEAAPAAPVKKQPAAVQENTAAVQPVKAAAVEVGGAYIWGKICAAIWHFSLLPFWCDKLFPFFFFFKARMERLMKDNISQKPPVTQVPQKLTDGEPTAKQNNLPASTQQSKHSSLSDTIQRVDFSLQSSRAESIY